MTHDRQPHRSISGTLARQADCAQLKKGGNPRVAQKQYVDSAKLSFVRKPGDCWRNNGYSRA